MLHPIPSFGDSLLQGVFFGILSGMVNSALSSSWREHVQKILKRRGMRYLIVGGTVYVLELIIIIVAQKFGASPTQAVAVSFTLGLIVSFFLQKLFSFGDRRMHHKIIIPQAVAVGLLVMWNFSFTVGMTRLLQDMLPPTVTRTIALGITTIWNYYLYKTHIFTPSER